MTKDLRPPRRALRTGGVSPDQYLIPGSVELLEGLKARGLKMYLASGTDEPT